MRPLLLLLSTLVLVVSSSAELVDEDLDAVIVEGEFVKA